MSIFYPLQFGNLLKVKIKVTKVYTHTLRAQSRTSYQKLWDILPRSLERKLEHPNTLPKSLPQTSVRFYQEVW